MPDVLYENRKLFTGLICLLLCINVICCGLYVLQFTIPFWLIVMTILVSVPVFYLLFIYRKKLKLDMSLLSLHGYALYEIPCICIYNGYQIDSAKLFIYQYGLEYIDSDRFSYFGFLPFDDIESVDLVETQLQINCRMFMNDVLLAFESDNLLELQLIYNACNCNGANFDDNFAIVCNNLE